MSAKAPICILIPTRNEERNLPYALESVMEWAQQVFILDSGSTDRTEQISREHGASFVFHAWEGYARQKNWGLDNLPITAKWVFILDADEMITPALRDELIRISTADQVEENGFYVNRYFVFLGRRIRHCGYYPSWNIRFFRMGKARYEEREVHEHMKVEGKVGYLRGEMEHQDRRGIEHFIEKHNHYSTLEAREVYRAQQKITEGLMKARFFGGPVERRRWIKHHIWHRLGARWLVRWLYMYVWKLGVLDGQAGFHLCFLLAHYEHQISLKVGELEMRKPRWRPPARQPVPALLPPPASEAQMETVGAGASAKSHTA